MEVKLRVYWKTLQMNILSSPPGMEAAITVQSKKAEGGFCMAIALRLPMGFSGHRKTGWKWGGAVDTQWDKSLKGNWVLTPCSFLCSLVQSASSIKCSIILQYRSNNPDCKKLKKHHRSLPWHFRTKLVMCIVST